LIKIVRESPATCFFCACWILIYIWMIVYQGRYDLFALGRNPLSIGGVLVPTTHLFGDATPVEIYAGEWRRALAATFVHYGLLHVLINMYGLFQLGRLIEEWYGSAWFAAIYLAIGGLGDAIANLVRPWIGKGPAVWTTHSAGGSTVVFGLVGLCAIVGWRSKTRIGDYLMSQMVGLLFVNGFLGVIFSGIDNTAHAAGALCGAAIGFAHKGLRKSATSKLAYSSGILSIVVLAACAALQTRSALREIAAERELESIRARLADAQKKIQLWMILAGVYHALVEAEARAAKESPSMFSPVAPRSADPRISLALGGVLKELKKVDPNPGENGKTARILASRALFKLPIDEEVAEFDAAINRLIESDTRDIKNDFDVGKHLLSVISLPDPPAWAGVPKAEPPGPASDQPKNAPHPPAAPNSAVVSVNPDPKAPASDQSKNAPRAPASSNSAVVNPNRDPKAPAAVRSKSSARNPEAPKSDRDSGAPDASVPSSSPNKTDSDRKLFNQLK
jgi:membrane associated rhomboid family serine protease